MRKPFVSSLASSIASSISSPLTGDAGGGQDSLLEQVQALYTSGGGAYSGAILAFGRLGSIWQDASATTPASVGDPIWRVDDLSGDGNNAAVVSSGQRPLATDIGGNLVARADGIDDKFSANGAASISNNMTIVYALIPRVASAFNGILSFDANDFVVSANDTGAGTGGVRVIKSGGNVISEAGTDQTGIAQVLTFQNNATTGVVARRNGVQIGTSINVSAIVSTTLTLAQSQVDVAAFVAINSSTPSSEELALLEQYAASTIGVTL